MLDVTPTPPSPEAAPKTFGIPLSQVIANDRAHRQRQDALKEGRRDCLELEASVLHFRAEQQRRRRQHDGSELPSKPPRPLVLEAASRSQRRGGLSVDSISDLVESQSRLLEALQLSHPHELDGKRVAGRSQAKLSLNPIYRQVPRVVDLCCRHLETHGLQTVGIFRVGSSKKRVRQLREDFDMGVDVILDEEHSVHDVAALLKKFLRDMPDPLLPREFYPAFLQASRLKGAEQFTYLQLLLYLLPPSNCDTLLRLLTLLHTVQLHAQDSVGPDNQEIPGNKMTAANLAVIFGPNLLRKERCSDKDQSVQAAGMEDSSAIISVTLRLIQNHKQLFLVPVELQQEVLLSLMQTDPDIIVYLLRRKLSGGNATSEGDGGGRRATKASLDSAGLSSGDTSPSEPPRTHFPDRQAEVDLSSEVIFNALQLNQMRKRDDAGKSIARIRQFHSHHNLLSLARPTSRPSCDYEGVGSPGAERTVHFSLGDESRTRQQTSSAADDAKPSSANFWDFFTRKAPSADAVG
ncbi:rho GTPase-activating protein 6-like [Arapaima gigas]